MNKDDLDILMNSNFADYLKYKLDELNMSMRRLSELSLIEYKVLSKITVSKGKPRNTKFTEFIAILDVFGDDIQDYMDFVFGRVNRTKYKHKLMKQLNLNQLSLLNHILTEIDPEQVTDYLLLLNHLPKIYRKQNTDKNKK
ncbi:MAG: hypothetical protein HFE82_09435 [Erysipelotrichaceae bacterium]|nr:hypothetical protein [Erysipelotrichaceae bacterium]